MKKPSPTTCPFAVIAIAISLNFAPTPLAAADWPQWRGANRDGKVAEFVAPKTWPKQLTQKWKVTVGEGVATPALVGDKLYVFSRQENNEITRCLMPRPARNCGRKNTKHWAPAGRPQSYSGPRSSPAVANGKVVTLGVRGMLSCLTPPPARNCGARMTFPAPTRAFTPPPPP